MNIIQCPKPPSMVSQCRIEQPQVAQGIAKCADMHMTINKRTTQPCTHVNLAMLTVVTKWCAPLSDMLENVDGSR
ncbi:hypothetical protein Csa_008657 [Cucumis sativus]|uniref:Uncharacterized protein n=1 Tax=Cucumis sativus TaxID=3659 RepID=A0A0A0KP66_CUCSA|nr:hypothetical protein Csa_008657 [Cucumis sativus]